MSIAMTVGSMAIYEKGLCIIYNSMLKGELEYRLVRAGKYNTLETCQYLLAQMADRGYAVGCFGPALFSRSSLKTLRCPALETK